MRDIESLIRSFKTIYPTVTVRQLEVLHPGADDDGIWFFWEPAGEVEVQVESTTGMCPFLIETDETDERITANTVDQAIETLARLLHLKT